MKRDNELLLIIDMQNGFFNNLNLFPDRQEIVSNILELKKHFQSKKSPIVYMTITHKEDGSTLGIEASKPWNTEGSLDAEIIAELLPTKKDYVMNKSRFSAFFKTSLLDFTRNQNIKKVYISGLTASMCIMNTSLDCYNNDIQSVVVVDAIMDDSLEKLTFLKNHFISCGIGLSTENVLEHI